MTTPGTTTWPRTGRCGACGRPARAYPSGRWEHDGRPCRARSQTLWRIDDIAIRAAVHFVADGEPLPTEPAKPHWHETTHDKHGTPTGLGWCQVDHTPSIRDWLARGAEQEVPT